MADNATSSNNYPTQVGLGCGTLILLGIMIWFLGRADLEPLEFKIAGLRTEVQHLRADINELRRDLVPQQIAPDASPSPSP